MWCVKEMRADFKSILEFKKLCVFVYSIAKVRKETTRFTFDIIVPARHPRRIYFATPTGFDFECPGEIIQFIIADAYNIFPSSIFIIDKYGIESTE